MRGGQQVLLATVPLLSRGDSTSHVLFFPKPSNSEKLRVRGQAGLQLTWTHADPLNLTPEVAVW